MKPEIVQKGGGGHWAGEDRGNAKGGTGQVKPEVPPKGEGGQVKPEVAQEGKGGQVKPEVAQ